MANPFYDAVISLGKQRRWYRMHDSGTLDSGEPADTGLTSPVKHFDGATGSYTVRQAGPLQQDDTTYSILLNDADVYRGSGFGSSDFNGSTTTGSISFFFKTSYTADTQHWLSSHPDNNVFNIYMTAAGAIGWWGQTGSNGCALTTDTNGYNDGNWHFIVLLSDGSAKNKIYIDGAEVSTTRALTGLADSFWIGSMSHTSIMVGNDTRTATVFLPAYGYISELIFWSGALSASEIDGLYIASQAEPIVPVEGGIRRSYRKTHTA